MSADGKVSRRSLLTQAGALGAWLPLGPLDATGDVGGARPPGFPEGIEVYRQGFRNWAGDIRLDAVPTCAPRSAEEVVQIINWASQSGYRIRPRGMAHNWSPLTLSDAAGQPQRLVLLDTTKHLRQVSTGRSGGLACVRAQSGVTMSVLLSRLEASGLGMTATPAPGDLTLGGVLAVDGHGTGVPAQGESRLPGHTYGSLSNLVLELQAVVYDAHSGRYVLRTFTRDAPEMAGLLVHVGRAFVTEATLRVGANQRLRCQSFLDVPASELFGVPASGRRTLSRFLDQAGRVEAIWYPFTAFPWLKVWSRSPDRPSSSRLAGRPFNYPFSDNLPEGVSALLTRIVQGEGWLTPLLGTTMATITAAGLKASRATDLWGWSKNLLLYIKPTTLRVTANGYAILTRRRDVQRVVQEFATHYQSRLDAYRRVNQFPVNGPLEVRVTGLDRPEDVAQAGATTAALSAIRPSTEHPDWDTAVWIDMLTFPGTPGAAAFYREMEQWIYGNYRDDYAGVRVEWSKGWGYGHEGPWSDPLVLGYEIPRSFRDGVGQGNWNGAVAALNRLDPFRVFSAPLHDQLMP